MLGLALCKLLGWSGWVHCTRTMKSYPGGVLMGNVTRALGQDNPGLVWNLIPGLKALK